MKKLAIVFFLLISIKFTLADVVINELMYDPAGNEYDFEYLELYGQEDISNWYLEGIDFTFPANTSINDYLVIANTLNDSGDDNDFLDRYPDVNCSFEYTGTLSNDGETIILRDNNNNIIDLVTYEDVVNENHSLERIDINKNSNDPSNWAESILGGTPGQENSVSFISGCDWMVSIIINNTVSDDPEWQIRASKLEGDGKANITIKHWVEDHDGDIIKTYSDINIENALSQSTSNKYSPSLNKGQGFFIKANITNISCNDKDSSNNFVSELIFVPEEQSSYSLNSSINILSVSPSNIEFGDIVKANINVYRGDTLKYAVYAYIENDDEKEISEKSTMHFKNKFTNYTLTVPIQLKPNCDEDYDDGEHILIIEGLDLIATEIIEIEGIKNSLCDTAASGTSSTSSSSSRKKFSYELISRPNEIEAGKEFEIQVKLINENKEGHYVDIWSYVYRGSKSYTGHRQDNLQTIFLPAESSRTAVLKNLIEEADPGDYKLKIKMIRDDYKTEKEITQTIKVIEYEAEEINEQDLEIEDNINEENTRKFIPNQDPLIVYESNSYKSKRLVPFFIIGLLGFFSIILVWRR